MTRRLPKRPAVASALAAAAALAALLAATTTSGTASAAAAPSATGTAAPSATVTLPAVAAPGTVTPGAPATRGTARTSTPGAGAGTAHAAGTPSPPATAPATYDVSAFMRSDPVTQLPGRTVTLIAMVNGGSADAPLGFTMTVPKGAHVEMQSGVTDKCTLAADGRLLTCDSTYVTPTVGIDADAAPGPLTFTMTVTLGDVVDPDLSNNTASTTVQVVAKGADWGVEWRAPRGPVRAGEVVTTPVVVTNHGPDEGTADVQVVPPQNAEDFWQPLPKGCWADDPGSIICELTTPVPPHSSIVLPFAWKFRAVDRGKTFHFMAITFLANTDTNPDNDKAAMDLHVAPAPGTPQPTRTAAGGTHGAGSGPSPQTGAQTALAATGAAGTAALTASAALAAAGGTALVLAARRRRRAAHR